MLPRTLEKDEGEIIRVQQARHSREGEMCMAEIHIGGFEDDSSSPCPKQGVWTIVSYTRHVGATQVRRRRATFCENHVPKRFASLIEWERDARNPLHKETANA